MTQKELFRHMDGAWGSDAMKEIPRSGGGVNGHGWSQVRGDHECFDGSSEASTRAILAHGTSTSNP